MPAITNHAAYSQYLEGGMSRKRKILFYFPGNVATHAEVTARKRRNYIGGFVSWARVLQNAPFPVASSFQGMDYEMAGVLSIPSGGMCEFLNAPYGHPLTSVLESQFLDHMRWQYRHGVTESLLGLFNAEFDIYRDNTIPAPSRAGEPQVMFGLANGETLMYSLGMGEVKGEGKFGPGKPVHFHDKIIVPLHGVKAAQDAFFLWQRLPSKVNAYALAAELWKLTEALDDDQSGDVITFFMDIEAPLVGSHRGLEIWEMFFALVVEAGLVDHVIGFTEAVKHWRETAVKPPEGASRFFVRHTGDKWTGLHTQIDWLMKIAAGLRPKDNEADQVAWSFVTSSDILAVLNRRHHGDMVRPGERGEIRISVDQTVVTVGEVIFQAFVKKMRPEDALRRHKFDDPDARWYADKVADLIASHR